MLSAIYIKGFKTFVRPIRMPLGAGVTAIVGPNGSGKSNITDAVLFALGEGSPTLLRAGSMEDVIFSGSDSLPAAGVAEVTLALDNSSGRISLPYHEVSITRRISRGGETEYRINGVRARLADVRAVAGEAGLGRHSILRQGAVDAIVAGGPAACRTALEETAGLMVFRRRRLVASRKLERAAAQLESSRQLEAELSAQLGRIEAEAVAAREYRELEARYRELSLAHLYRVATQGLDEGRERLEDLDARVAALETRQEVLREEARRLGEEEKQLGGRISAAERILQGLEQSSEALRVGTLRTERALLRLEGARDKGVDRSRVISRLETELEGISSKVWQLEEEVGRLEEQHSRRKEASRRSEELLAQGRAEHAAAAKQLAQLAGKLEALREKRERVANRLEACDTLRDEELGRLKEIGEELGAYAPKVLSVRCAAVLERFQDLRRSTAGLAAEADRRRGVLATLVGRTEAEIRALKDSGRGVVGGKRLYEIVRPRPGYEAAVEAALGDIASGVLAKTLGEGMRFLSGDNPAERVVVRLDAKGVPKNGAPPGKSLLDCIEILDTSYTGALERLLGGAYVLERADRTAPESGYDVAVTRDGLRFTRTSASRFTSNGDFARQARLVEEEQRLEVLRAKLGRELYELREDISRADRRLDGKISEVEAFAALASRAARIMRLLVPEAERRASKAQATRERRAAAEVDLNGIEAEISASEGGLRGAQEGEERAKEELEATLSAVEAAYTATREAAGRLARARTDLESARKRRARISRALVGLKNASTPDANTDWADLARRAGQHARRLDAALHGRLARLRRTRSESATLQGRDAEKRLKLTQGAAEAAEDLLRVRSEAAMLRRELSRSEEARKAAESEIFDEWGATLEAARMAAEALPEATGPERARLARRLKNFGDVNLLAIGQEGQLRERYEFVVAQRSDAEAAAAEIERIIRNVDDEIEARFQATFEEVRQSFGAMIPRMMEGAAGELSLSEEGVEIGLRLRGRGWRPLRVLSGGERSLLALAFLFSILLGRSLGGPGIFCMLDEAEAALDDLNLARFLAVVDSYRADGQFLLVTHQKRTMAAADVLYGVTQDASGATVVVSKRLTGE